MLPVLPEKAAQGLEQMNIRPGAHSLTDLLAADLPEGHKVGTGQPLFKKVE